MDFPEQSGPAYTGGRTYFDEGIPMGKPIQEPFGYPGMGHPSVNPFLNLPDKRKFLAGLFSFFVPGTGHFYLGLMQKGLLVMLMFIFSISAMVFATGANSFSGNTYLPLVVVLGCLIPVTYFFSLFDALQCTDQVNAYRRAVRAGHIPPAPPGTDALGKQVHTGVFGIGFMGIGVVLFLVSAKPAWLEDLFKIMGSYVGAVLLIGVGLLLFLNESKKK
ncbi:MAG: hypothetical protein K0Q90_4270 [Paenibacillaceae bacterium]|nr:hypothetical protein [Paenibacillaceae bacterium]